MALGAHNFVVGSNFERRGGAKLRENAQKMRLEGHNDRVASYRDLHQTSVLAGKETSDLMAD